MRNAVLKIRKDYLFTRAIGTFNLRSAEQILAGWIQRAQEHGLNKIVCDVRSVNRSEPSLSIIALYGISRMITRLLPPTTRLAIIGRLEGYDTAEDLLRKRGVQIFFTADYRKAVRWVRRQRGTASTIVLQQAA